MAAGPPCLSGFESPGEALTYLCTFPCHLLSELASGPGAKVPWGGRCLCLTLPSAEEEGTGADSALSRGGPRGAQGGTWPPAGAPPATCWSGRRKTGPRPRTGLVRGPWAWKEQVRGAWQAKEAAKDRPSLPRSCLTTFHPSPPPDLGPKASHGPLASAWPQKMCLIQLQGTRKDPSQGSRAGARTAGSAAGGG